MIKVFISSVQREFEKERREVAEYIREDAVMGRFFEPFLFEELPAKDVSAAQAYLTEVADTDVYLGLFGENYGYEDQKGVSPTEREYDCATANHKYRIVLIKEAEQRHPKEASLIKKAEQDVVRNSRILMHGWEKGQHRHRWMWNLGRLPKGMTIEKLSGEHASLPVNPLLANPVYLAGYIEQVGTGTNDVIDRCLKMGLRKPEFRQDEDFSVVIWRRAGKEAGNVTGNETGNETGNVSGNVKRIVLSIDGATLTREEIMQRMGLKGSGNFRAAYLYPAIEQGYVLKLYPESDKRRDQAYYLSEKGLRLMQEITRE